MRIVFDSMMCLVYVLLYRWFTCDHKLNTFCLICRNLKYTRLCINVNCTPMYAIVFRMKTDIAAKGNLFDILPWCVDSKGRLTNKYDVRYSNLIWPLINFTFYYYTTILLRYSLFIKVTILIFIRYSTCECLCLEMHRFPIDWSVSVHCIWPSSTIYCKNSNSL